MPAGDYKQGSNLEAFFDGGQIAGTTEAAVHTVTASTREKIASFSLCNNSASAVTVSVGLVKSGGTIGDGTHRVLSGYILAAFDTISQEDVLSAVKGAMLPAGTVIAVAASTGAVIDWTVSGTVSS